MLVAERGASDPCPSRICHAPYLRVCAASRFRIVILPDRKSGGALNLVETSSSINIGGRHCPEAGELT
jgi:hypothetical protein